MALSEFDLLHMTPAQAAERLHRLTAEHGLRQWWFNFGFGTAGLTVGGATYLQAKLGYSPGPSPVLALVSTASVLFLLTTIVRLQQGKRSGKQELRALYRVGPEAIGKAPAERGQVLGGFEVVESSDSALRMEAHDLARRQLVPGVLQVAALPISAIAAAIVVYFCSFAVFKAPGLPSLLGYYPVLVVLSGLFVSLSSGFGKLVDTVHSWRVDKDERVFVIECSDFLFHRYEERVPFDEIDTVSLDGHTLRLRCGDERHDLADFGPGNLQSFHWILKRKPWQLETQAACLMASIERVTGDADPFTLKPD